MKILPKPFILNELDELLEKMANIPESPLLSRVASHTKLDKKIKTDSRLVREISDMEVPHSHF